MILMEEVKVLEMKIKGVVRKYNKKFDGWWNRYVRMLGEKTKRCRPACQKHGSGESHPFCDGEQGQVSVTRRRRTDNIGCLRYAIQVKQ